MRYNIQMRLFQTKEYQEIFARNFCKEEDVVWTDYGGFSVKDGVVKFLGMEKVLGGEEVTDYGDISVEKNGYGKAWRELFKLFRNKGCNRLQLDYVREDSQTFEYFYRVQGPSPKLQEVAPYIDLPESWEEYLISLKRKYRKELRRKIKRLEEQNSFYQCTKETIKEDFEEFVRLHRLSDSEKNKFMTDKMKVFFQEVKAMNVVGWQSHLCFLKLDKKVVAGVMTFESDDEVWLYNSGYNPEYSYYSVGLMLKAYKIKKAIEKGKKRFDFLRGDERYKYELGAKDKKLYKINVRL